MYCRFKYTAYYTLLFTPSRSIIKMQLRSGKTTRSDSNVNVDYNARFYGKIHQRENITMTMEEPTPSGKTTTKSSITKHHMRLRSYRLVTKAAEPMHFADMVSEQIRKDQANIRQERVFHNWLVARLRRLVVDDYKQISGVYTTPNLMERLQLMVEMVAVIKEHIDYIATCPEFARFSQLIVSKMSDLAKQITTMLNGDPDNGVVFNLTLDERSFIGNVRADMVNLMVITKNLLPKV